MLHFILATASAAVVVAYAAFTAAAHTAPAAASDVFPTYVEL